MKTALILISLMATIFPAMAEQMDERIAGQRSLGNHRCVVEHWTLSTSHDFAMVVDFFPTVDEQSDEVSDVGSLAIDGIDFQGYNRILYSNETISTTFPATVLSNYSVSVRAISNGQTRTISLAMSPQSSNYHPKEVIILVQQNKIKKMTLVEKQQNFFGGYKTIFSDTCVL